MATYLELRSLFTHDDLRNKVVVAMAIAAQKIAAGEDTTDPPWSQDAGAHDNRVRWAARVINNTSNERDRMLLLVLAKNNTSSVAQITGATDAIIQSNVEEMVDLIAAADFTA